MNTRQYSIMLRLIDAEHERLQNRAVELTRLGHDHLIARCRTRTNELVGIRSALLVAQSIHLEVERNRAAVEGRVRAERPRNARKGR
jgi:hypothetical protein